MTKKINIIIIILIIISLSAYRANNEVVDTEIEDADSSCSVLGNDENNNNAEYEEKKETEEQDEPWYDVEDPSKNNIDIDEDLNLEVVKTVLTFYNALNTSDAELLKSTLVNKNLSDISRKNFDINNDYNIIVTEIGGYTEENMANTNDPTYYGDVIAQTVYNGHLGADIWLKKIDGKWLIWDYH